MKPAEGLVTEPLARALLATPGIRLPGKITFGSFSAIMPDRRLPDFKQRQSKTGGDPLRRALSRTGALVFRNASAGIIFCPEHAQLLAGAGMTKHDVRRWLVAHCHRSSADLRRVGKDGVTDKGVRYDLDGPEDDTVERIFETDSPKDLMIIVAGARNAGISTVVRLFASWSQVTARVEPQRIADVKEIHQ
jgi:hypothetical protein